MYPLQRGMQLPNSVPLRSTGAISEHSNSYEIRATAWFLGRAIPARKKISRSGEVAIEVWDMFKEGLRMP
jgi:hypothetical protein